MKLCSFKNRSTICVYMSFSAESNSDKSSFILDGAQFCIVTGKTVYARWYGGELAQIITHNGQIGWIGKYLLDSHGRIQLNDSSYEGDLEWFFVKLTKNTCM